MDNLNEMETRGFILIHIALGFPAAAYFDNSWEVLRIRRTGEARLATYAKPNIPLLGFRVPLLGFRV